jgi:hypothetical protein
MVVLPMTFRTEPLVGRLVGAQLLCVLFWIRWYIGANYWKLTLATPNYGFEKRQRELAKKMKKQDKLQAKSERKNNQRDEMTSPPADAQNEETSSDHNPQQS